MANERKKAKKAKLKENKDRLVLYYTANNVESAASESSHGESFDSGRFTERAMKTMMK